MPDFEAAIITRNQGVDLEPSLGFLHPINPGTNVSLDLVEGETSRKVMRALNAAAKLQAKRLVPLPGHSAQRIHFKVMPLAKRAPSVSGEAAKERARKGQATRIARLARKD